MNDTFTLDLFAGSQRPNLAEYSRSLEGWLADEERAGRLQRESSTDVYLHMWSAFAAWAVGHGIGLDDIDAQDLARYLDFRGGCDDLSARYAWRLLRLVDRVQVHRAVTEGGAPNRAAGELLMSRPDLRYANASDRDPLPDYLAASEAKRLVAYLCAVRPGRPAASRSWQDVRNSASVGLMLGAGITPGEVRALQLLDVLVDGGRSKGTPWKLRVDGDGNGPARETPMSPWAGILLRYWLDVRAAQGFPGQMLFPATRASGKPWGKVAQYTSTRDVLTAAGIDEPGGGSFRLRHTFALRQLRRGTSPADVASWLGVTDPDVMARYQRVVMAPVDVV